MNAHQKAITDENTVCDKVNQTETSTLRRNAVLAPPHPSADYARWRVWAAHIRDGYVKDCPEASGLAGALCMLLDTWDALRARRDKPLNLCDGLNDNICQIVEKLLTTFGMPPPAGV